MGVQHLQSVYSHLASEVKGKYVVLRDVRYNENEQKDQRFNLILKKTQKRVATMTVRSLPGCCGVAVLHSFSGEPNAVIDFIWAGLDAMKKAKYGQALFTLRSNSAILQDFLSNGVEATDHNGAVCQFMNGKTGHQVTTVVVNLRAEAPRGKDTEGE